MLVFFVCISIEWRMHYCIRTLKFREKYRNEKSLAQIFLSNLSKTRKFVSLNIF